MPSTYSSNLKIELQATGENSGTWGNITNTNLGTALEQAIVGYGNPNFGSDANLTLTYTDTNAAQAARALVLNVTSSGSLTATRELVVPTIQKQYIVQNNTTGSQSITVKTSGGTGITVPAGRKAHLYVDGTNVIYMDDFVDINGGAIDGTAIGASSASTGAFTTLSASSTATLSNLTASTALALDASKNIVSVTNTGTGNNVLATSPTLVTPALGAATATSINKVAVTAPANAATLTLSDGSSLITSGGHSLTLTTTGTTNVTLPTSGTLATTAGTVASFSAGTTGLTPNTATTGAVTLGGTLAVANGGTGITSFGTGVATALGVNVGSAGAFVVNGGALGTPSSGTVTNLTGTASININGTVGATTPSTGAFTTLTTSSTVTLNGGTANGVLYLNGSKVATSGSAITFDGTNFATTGTATATKLVPTGNVTAGNGMYLPAANTLAFSTNGSERVRVDSSGNVGIGTTNPNYRLLVDSGSTTGVAAAFGYNGDSGTNLYISVDHSANLVTLAASGNTGKSLSFQIGNSQVAIFDRATGNFFIGNGVTAASPSNGVLSATGGSGTNITGATLTIEGGRGTGSGAGGPIVFSTSAAGASGTTLRSATERMRIDSAGNLGLGVTPNSGWVSTSRALQVGSGPSLSQQHNGAANLMANSYESSPNAFTRIGTGFAVRYNINPNDGVHSWYTAANTSGAITFTQAMTLDASGNLGVGTTSPEGTIHASKTSSAGLGGQLILDNPASSAVGTAVEISFLTEAGASGTGIRNARIRAVNENAGNAATNIQFWTYNGSADAERARITAGGDLLVGTTNAVFSAANRGNITIGGSVSSLLFLGTGSTTGSYVYHEQSTGGMEVWNTTNSYIRFGTNNTERARITAGGAFLVNSTTDTHSGVASKCILKSDDNVLGVVTDSGTTQAVRFTNGTTAVGSIGLTTTATSYNVSSDRRLKENIALSDDAGSVIDVIEVVKHDWKVGGHVRYGVIAQDLHKVAPEAVTIGDADDVEELKNPWGVDYSKLVPMLVKEIQSLRARVAALEAAQ